MAKQKKTGFGTYITTLVVDSDLTTTEARLFAFMQLHVDYRTGVFDLKRKTTCAKLDINLSYIYPRSAHTYRKRARFCQAPYSRRAADYLSYSAAHGGIQAALPALFDFRAP